MATIKFGALVVGARGTIGGVTYSASKSGPYARSWSRGSNPRTTKQQTNRARVSNQPAFWRALTSTQRTAWNTWAALPAQQLTNALGETYFISGYSWFVTINVRLARAGFAHRTDPPTDLTPAVPVIDVFTFELVAGNPLAEIEYDPAEFPAGVGIVIEASIVVSGGHTAQHRGFKMLISSISPVTGVYDFTSELVAAFGTPSAGWQCFLRIYKQTDEGMRGGPATMVQTYTV